MPACDTEETTMITHNGPTELGNVVLEVNQILRLLMSRHIIEMDVLVSPLEVMYDALVSQLLLYDEDVLEEVNYSLFNIKVIEFSYHRLLVLQVLLIGVDQGVTIVNRISEVIKDSTIVAHVDRL
jgi:hypothetical protein